MRRRFVPAILILLGVLEPGLAQEPPPEPPPQDQPRPDDEPEPAEAEAEAEEENEDAAPPARERHLETLRETVVHFAFQRAPLSDVTTALERATGVPVRIGAAAREVLDERKWRIKYVADRTGLQVLEDLAKAAALDVVVTDEGAVLDTKAEIRRLRVRLGLAEEAVRLDPEDVTRALRTKRLSLVSNDKSLTAVLAFLRRETGVPFVRLSESREEGAEEPRITLRLTDTPLGEVLERALGPVGFGWLQQGSVVVVGTTEGIAAVRLEEEGR